MIRIPLVVRPWRFVYCVVVAAGTVLWLGWMALVPVMLMGIDREVQP